MMYTREIIADYGTGKREYVEFTERNAKGETIAIELSTAQPMKHWAKRGVTNNYIHIQVYVTDGTGCWGKYNPQITADHKINFGYLPDDTEENRLKVIDDIYAIAFKAAN